MSEHTMRVVRRVLFTVFCVLTVAAGCFGFYVVVVLLGSGWAGILSGFAVFVAALLIHPDLAWHSTHATRDMGAVAMLWFALMANAIAFWSFPLYLGFAGAVIALVVTDRLLRRTPQALWVVKSDE